MRRRIVLIQPKQTSARIPFLSKGPDDPERTATPPIVLNALRAWKLQCHKTELGLVFPSPMEDVEIIGRDYIVKRGL